MFDIETTGMLLGAGLTFLILTYLLGDNPFYRLALHLFIGAVVGYSFGIAVREVLLKTALFQLQSDPILVVPLVMGLWLFLFKSIPRLAHMGNFVLAYLIGVGTAVALSGALLGTLVPQVGATVRALNLEFPDLPPLTNGLLVVVGMVCTLMVFNFTTPKEGGLAGAWAQVVGALAWVGRAFLIFAFALAFAGALTTSLSILIGRIQYIITPLVNLLGS
ncbi:MAG: hypothetical protein ACE5OS_14200 [Anaerolineae bacterium]